MYLYGGVLVDKDHFLSGGRRWHDTDDTLWPKCLWNTNIIQAAVSVRARGCREDGHIHLMANYYTRNIRMTGHRMQYRESSLNFLLSLWDSNIKALARVSSLLKKRSIRLKALFLYWCKVSLSADTGEFVI